MKIYTKTGDQGNFFDILNLLPFINFFILFRDFKFIYRREKGKDWQDIHSFGNCWWIEFCDWVSFSLIYLIIHQILMYSNSKIINRIAREFCGKGHEDINEILEFVSLVSYHWFSFIKLIVNTDSMSTSWYWFKYCDSKNSRRTKGWYLSSFFIFFSQEINKREKKSKNL